MAESGSSRLWTIVGLIALGVVIAATLPRLGSDEAEIQEGDSTEAREAEEQSTYEPGGDLATRRIAEDCNPVTEAKQYEEFIDRRARVVLSWNNMREQAADLKIPVYVRSVDDGVIGLGILEIPMRDQYVIIWIRSGHIKRGPGDTFLLDPCSASIEAWEAMDRLHPRADVEDEGEDEGAGER